MEPYPCPGEWYSFLTPAETTIGTLRSGIAFSKHCYELSVFIRTPSFLDRAGFKFGGLSLKHSALVIHGNSAESKCGEMVPVFRALLLLVVQGKDVGNPSTSTYFQSGGS